MKRDRMLNWEATHKLGIFNTFFYDCMWLIILIYTYLNFLLIAPYGLTLLNIELNQFSQSRKVAKDFVIY